MPHICRLSSCSILFLGYKHQRQSYTALPPHSEPTAPSSSIGYHSSPKGLAIALHPSPYPYQDTTYTSYPKKKRSAQPRHTPTLRPLMKEETQRATGIARRRVRGALKNDFEDGITQLYPHLSQQLKLLTKQEHPMPRCERIWCYTICPRQIATLPAPRPTATNQDIELKRRVVTALRSIDNQKYKYKMTMRKRLILLLPYLPPSLP